MGPRVSKLGLLQAPKGAHASGGFAIRFVQGFRGCVLQRSFFFVSVDPTLVTRQMSLKTCYKKHFGKNSMGPKGVLVMARVLSTCTK